MDNLEAIVLIEKVIYYLNQFENDGIGTVPVTSNQSAVIILGKAIELLKK